MKIRQIEENDWESIIEIQRQAYTDIKPESEPVLKRKYIISPETCVVAVDDHENIIGCCLSHPWNPDNSPPLYKEIEKPVDTNNLYIHDLAVSRKSQRKGVANNLCNMIIARAKSQGFKSITLVAVQNSESFWCKFGFSRNSKIKPSQTYGEGAIFMELELNA